MNYQPEWVNSPEMQDYYDNYWAKPVKNERQLFEFLTLEMFQSGLSWSTVWRKRAALDAAFHHYDLAKIAQMTDKYVEALLKNPAIIRHRQKIEATINNATIIKQWHEQGKNLQQYFDQKIPQPLTATYLNGQLAPQDEHSLQISRELKKAGLKFLGPVTIYSFLCATGYVKMQK